MKTEQKVRLSQDYIDTIKYLAKKYFQSEDVMIFGSRADMSLKGGDIDIFIKTNITKRILQLKLAFLRNFELKHGEQKIDLVIQTGDETKEIYNEARIKGIAI